MSPLAGYFDTETHQRLVAREPSSKADVAVSLTVGFNPELPSNPAIAVWAESATGAMIETLYLDPNLAYSDKPVGIHA